MSAVRWQARAVVLVACSFASALLVAWMVGGVVGSSSGRGEAHWGQRIASCVLGPMTPEQTHFDPDCILRVWHEAYASGEMPEHNRAMLAQQERTPFISGMCHGLGHSIGTEYVEAGYPLRELLATQSEPPFSCNVGFLHGVMDGLAVSSPSREDMLAAFAVCEIMTPPNRPDCVDGSGHLAYQATHDDKESVRLCLTYAEEVDRVSCVGGIVMQMFRPESDGSRGPDYRNEDAHLVMPAICRSWRQFGRSLEVMCYRTAQLPMSHDVDDATRRYRETLGSPGAALDADVVADLAEAWSESLARCRSLGDPDGVRECRDRGAKSVKFAAQQDNLVQAICALLDSDLRATCRRTEFG